MDIGRLKWVVCLIEVMHLSMVCPRIGVGVGQPRGIRLWFAPGLGWGSGNPGELDFVKHTWVGILTSTTIPGVGNLTRPPS